MASDATGTVIADARAAPNGAQTPGPARAHEPPTRGSRTALALKRVGVAAALLAVAGLAVLYVLRPPAVMVAAVTTRDIASAIQGIGTVEAKTLVSVSSKITGRVVAVLVDEGDIVTAGQLVARLDDAQYRADMDRAEATVRATDAQLRDLLAGARAEEIEQLRARLSSASATRTLTEQDFERVRNLFARELISAQDRDRARQAYDVGIAQEREARHALELALRGTRKDLIEAGRAQLQAAQAALVLAEEKLADTRIDSPLTGYVVSRELEAGSIVNPGAAIYKLADPTTAWATVSVDARDTAGVAVGDAADITFRSVPGRVFRGRVARIQREGDRVTEQLAVDVAFAERPARLTLGEQVEVAIRPDVRRGATALPLGALVRRPDGVGALVVADGRVHFRAARLGIVDPAGWAEVLEGLRPGDDVVLAPGLLADGSNEGRRVGVTRAPLGP